MPIFALSCKCRAANCLPLMQRVAFLSQCRDSCPITALYESVPHTGRFPANQSFPRVKGWYVVVHSAWRCLISLVTKYTTNSMNSSFQKNQKCLPDCSQLNKISYFPHIFTPFLWYTFNTLILKANFNHYNFDVTSKLT